MTILHQAPVLPADIIDALDAYDREDFSLVSQLLRPSEPTETIEVIRFPGLTERQLSYRISKEEWDKAPKLDMKALWRTWAAKEAAERDWRTYQALYAIPRPEFRCKPARPKWGQPGRGRRRKARFAARRLEANRQELAQEVKRMLADPGTFTAPM